MNKLLIAVMMMAGLTACSQEAKQETQETAQAVASEVKNEAASAADATASAAQEAADKVEAAASKAEEAAKPEEKAEAPAAEAKPAESAKVDGKAVFEANCKACHSGLIPGAPAVGKKKTGRLALNKVKTLCTNTQSKASKPCLPKAATAA